MLINTKKVMEFGVTHASVTGMIMHTMQQNRGASFASPLPPPFAKGVLCKIT